MEGQIDRKTGRIVNPQLIDRNVSDIIEELDHKRLDKDINYFKNKQSTGENIAMYIYEKLVGSGELNITTIRIWENSNSYFEHIKEDSNELS